MGISFKRKNIRHLGVSGVYFKFRYPQFKKGRVAAQNFINLEARYYFF